MPKRVIIARAPNGKVTTISPRLGTKGIPWGWEYLLVRLDELPRDKDLGEEWPTITRGKEIRTQLEFNKDKASLETVEVEQQAARYHIENMYRHRNELLQVLDVEFIRVLEPPVDKRRQKAIISFKQALRDFNISRDDFETEEDLLQHWPTLFKQTIDDFLPEEPKRRKWPWVVGLTSIPVIGAVTYWLLTSGVL